MINKNLHAKLGVPSSYNSRDRDVQTDKNDKKHVYKSCMATQYLCVHQLMFNTTYLYMYVYKKNYCIPTGVLTLPTTNPFA